MSSRIERRLVHKAEWILNGDEESTYEELCSFYQELRENVIGFKLNVFQLGRSKEEVFEDIVNVVDYYYSMEM